MSLSEKERKRAQRLANAFVEQQKLELRPLVVDGVLGGKSDDRFERLRYFLGENEDKITPKVDAEFLFRLEHPNKVVKPEDSKDFAVSKVTVERGQHRRDLRRAALDEPKDSDLYGGCRAVTNRVIEIVGDRAPVTSRKRAASDPLSIANPGSDHSGANPTADAVDFATVNNFALADEIARKLGGPADVADYQAFFITMDGKRFRVQIIAGTHGTGPHLHVGVARA